MISATRKFIETVWTGYANNIERNLFLSYSFFIVACFFITKSRLWDAIFYLLVIPFLFLYTNKFRNLKQFFYNDRLLLFVSAFVFSLVLTSALSVTPVNSDYFDYVRKDILTILFILSTYLYFYQYNENRIKIFFNVLITVSFFTALFLIYTFIDAGSKGRLIGGLGQQAQQILGAMSYGIVALITVYQLTKSKNIIHSFFYILAILVFVWLIYLTKSRGAIIALTISAFLYIALMAFSSNYRKYYLLIALSLIALLVLYVDDLVILFQRGSEFFLHRFTGKRLIIWADVIEHWKASPWFGYGIHSDLKLVNGQHHPHSIYIGALFYGGLVGFTLWITFLGLLIKRVITKATGLERKFSLVLLAFVLISTITDVPYLVTGSNITWIILWFPLIMVMALAQKSAAKSPVL